MKGKTEGVLKGCAGGEFLLVLSQVEPKDRYYQHLLHHTKVASTYDFEVLRVLEDEGLVGVKPSGRIHRLELTAKENKLAFHLLECARKLEQTSETKSLWG